MNMAVLCLALVGMSSDVTAQWRATRLRFVADFQEIAQGVEPRLREIHNGLVDDLPARYKKKLRGKAFVVVAEDKSTPLDSFNANATERGIVVSAGLVRRLDLLAFAAAHDQLYKTKFTAQCIATISGFAPAADAEWWDAFGRAVDRFDDRRDLWDKVDALSEGYHLAVIAHEQAHIYLGHVSDRDATLRKRRDYERAADLAALKALYRIDPGGDHVLAAIMPMSFLLTSVLMFELHEGEQATREMLAESDHPHPIERMRQAVEFFRDLQDRRPASLTPTASGGLADIENTIRLFDASDFVKP